LPGVTDGSRLGRAADFGDPASVLVTDIGAVVSVDQTVLLDDFVRDRALELTRFAYLVTGDRGRAEDLVQDVLFAMHRRFGTSLALDDPAAYARRAVVNAHVSWLRRRRVLEVPSERPPEVAWTDATQFDIVADRTWDALATLPARQRTVLVLRYYLGQTDREIAALFDCREGTIRSLAARAFKTLRPVLRPAGSAAEVAR
jgi:RNA polymerase sigma-70 factor (sigma-E family)